MSRQDVPRTTRYRTVSPNPKFPANRLNPLHFPVSRSNDIWSLIVPDSNLRPGPPKNIMFYM
jgi:hypothetical protein